MAGSLSPEDWLFDVATPLGFRVHVTDAYWQIVVGDGFLITTYPTDAVKEGEKIWPK